MIDPTFRNIDRLFGFSFNNGKKDPTGNSSVNYYMSPVEIKGFNLISALQKLMKQQ